MKTATTTVLQGDCRELLKTLPDESVQMCVTSPPYFALRSYLPSGHADKGLEIGSEKTPEEFLSVMVAVFREVWRVLRNDGTLWINLGDKMNFGKARPTEAMGNGYCNADGQSRTINKTLGPKQILGMPWRVAFALQVDGWLLRQDIIWHKPNPMPESVSDRCTKSHEYLFLLTKSPKYFYDAQAISEPCSPNTNPRRAKTPDGWDTSKGEGGHGNFHKNGREEGKTKEFGSTLTGGDYGRHHLGQALPESERRNGSWNGSEFHTGKTGEHQLGRSSKRRASGVNPKGEASTGTGSRANASFLAATAGLVERRNKRSVWTVPSAPFSDAHFATFPPDLIRPCILAGSRAGDTVLDPFGGSGTTAQVANEYGRNAIVIELNADYLPMIAQRTKQPGLAL